MRFRVAPTGYNGGPQGDKWLRVLEAVDWDAALQLWAECYIEQCVDDSHCPSDCVEVEGIDEDGVAHSGLVEVEWQCLESSWGSEFSVELIGAESHG